MPQTHKTNGFTLVEMAMVIAIVGILATGAVLAFGDLSEQRDRDAVCAARAISQTMISQGSTRLDVPPASMLSIAANRAMTQTAIRRSLAHDGGTHSGIVVDVLAGSINVTVDPSKPSSRTASLAVSNGNVTVSAIGGFTSGRFTTANLCD